MKRKSSELKRMAREILNGQYGILMGTTVVSVLISTLLLLPFEWNLESYTMSREFVIYMLASIVVSLIGVVMSTGIMWIGMKMARGQKYKFSDMFYGFTHHPDRYILATLLLFVVCLIPVIPAVVILIPLDIYAGDILFTIAAVILMIALMVAEILIALRYVLVYFLLLDHSELKIREAFRKSAELMKGNKGRMFYILLSFIGMGILGILSCGIGFLWIQPYMIQTQVNFYLDVTGELDERERAREEARQAQSGEAEQASEVRTYIDKRNTRLETAALIVGICGIVTACCGYTAIALGALTIILALLSRGGERQMSGKGLAGLVIGIVAIAIGITIVVAAVVYVIGYYGGIEGYMNAYSDLLNQYMQMQ